MASVLRIAAGGLAIVTGVAVARVGYAFWPLRVDRVLRWASPDLLYPFSPIALLPCVAAGAAGLFWCVARLTRPRTGPRWAGSVVRGVATATLITGALTVAGSLHHLRMAAAGDRALWLFVFHEPPNTTLAWAALGVGGLLRVAAGAAYPPGPVPPRRWAVSLLLRLLAVVLILAGAIGSAVGLVQCYRATLEPSTGRAFEYYSGGLVHLLLSLGVVGLGGILWVGVRLAYAPKPAAPPALPPGPEKVAPAA